MVAAALFLEPAAGALADFAGLADLTGFFPAAGFAAFSGGTAVGGTGVPEGGPPALTLAGALDFLAMTLFGFGVAGSAEVSAGPAASGDFLRADFLAAVFFTGETVASAAGSAFFSAAGFLTEAVASSGGPSAGTDAGTAAADGSAGVPLLDCREVDLAVLDMMWGGGT